MKRIAPAIILIILAQTAFGQIPRPRTPPPSNDTFSSAWNGQTARAPSMNAVYDAAAAGFSGAITWGSGLSFSAGTVSFAPTELEALTFGTGATASWAYTFDVAGATNPTMTVSATGMAFSHNVAGATYGSDGSISDAELLTLDNGALTEILVGGGAGSAPVWGTDIPTAVTIGSAYIYRAGGTDVPVTDGGTGASTAAAARTNLGIVEDANQVMISVTESVTVAVGDADSTQATTLIIPAGAVIKSVTARVTQACGTATNWNAYLTTAGAADHDTLLDNIAVALNTTANMWLASGSGGGDGTYGGPFNVTVANTISIETTNGAEPPVLTAPATTALIVKICVVYETYAIPAE